MLANVYVYVFISSAYALKFSVNAVKTSKR